MAELNILNPKNCNLADLKVETTQTADCIINKTTYPNGFILTTTQHADKFDISTIRPLIQIDEHTFQIPE